MEARIAPCRVGILGTSLSAIDAAVAVVARHGVFHTEDDKTTHFSLHPGSEALEITLMSRHGVLPEADFTARSRGSRWRLPLPPPSKRPLRRVATLC